MGVASLHFAATFVIVGISSFAVGMRGIANNGGEVQNMDVATALWRAVRWIWTPLAMAMGDPLKGMNGSLVGFAFIWSCVVGILAGMLVPWLYNWLHKPLYPPNE